MDFSVVLCTYNRAGSLKTTLASLRALEVPPTMTWELLLVDNNSTDSTRSVVEEFAATSGVNTHYVFEPRQGRSFALNRGIQQAKGEIIAFTDDDVTFDPNWLVSLKRAFKEWDCIAAGGKIVPVWNGPIPSWLLMKDQQAIGHFDLGDTPRELIYAHGANGAFRREAFEKYGMFQTGLSVDGKLLAGYEDDEFGHRLATQGEKIMYVPGAVVYHPVEARKLNKAYFRKWFYDTGRTMMWARIWPRQTVLYFGIPRFLFRALVENPLKWPFTRDEKLRFRRECLAWRAVGGIAEGCRTLWTNKQLDDSRAGRGGRTFRFTGPTSVVMPRILQMAWAKTKAVCRDEGFRTAMRKVITHGVSYVRIQYRGRRRLLTESTANYDLGLGVETGGRVHCADLETESKNWIYSTTYVPTPRDTFLKAVSCLPSDLSDFTFIDFGSGKGGAVLMASWFSFRRIIGVEFSRKLHDIAQRNVREYRNPGQKCKEISLVCMDFVDFHIPTGPLVCFFFNPAGEPVMKIAAQNIRASWELTPRKIYVVYVVPHFADLFQKGELFSVMGEGELFKVLESAQAPAKRALAASGAGG